LSKTRSLREPSGSSVRIGISLRVAMSSRVLVPTTARLIGLAQPPRPRPLRVGPRGLVVGVATGFIQPLSSHALVTRVRNLSASILTPALTPEHAFVSGFRLRRPQPTSTRVVSLRALRLRVPSTHSNPRSRGRLMQHCCCSPTDRGYLSRFVSCRGPASLVSCRVVLGHHTLQRFLPIRRRTTLSSRAILRAVSHLAVPRLRGFQPPVGCVLRRRRCSRRRWAAPLLVVLPLRGCLPASPHTSAGLLSWASIMHPSPSTPLAVRRGDPYEPLFEPEHTCALQSFREPEVRLVLPNLPPWGPCLRYLAT